MSYEPTFGDSCTGVCSPGTSGDAFCLIALGVGWSSAGVHLHRLSSLCWHGLGRQGLPKTPLFRITLYAPWCVRLPCRAIAKQTHVEPLWGLRGPAWVRGSLIRPWQRRPMWKLSGGSLGLPECAGLPATAMTKQTHVEFFCGLCGPACVCGLAL